MTLTREFFFKGKGIKLAGLVQDVNWQKDTAPPTGGANILWFYGLQSDRLSEVFIAYKTGSIITVYFCYSPFQFANWQVNRRGKYS